MTTGLVFDGGRMGGTTELKARLLQLRHCSDPFCGAIGLYNYCDLRCWGFKDLKLAWD